jgi:hypothetical protein
VAAPRLKAVELVDEAHRNGARLFMACRELGITIRTRQRWLRGRGKNIVKEDGRKDAGEKKRTHAGTGFLHPGSGFFMQKNTTRGGRGS